MLQAVLEIGLHLLLDSPFVKEVVHLHNLILAEAVDVISI
jgi:hypothetical protein